MPIDPKIFEQFFRRGSSGDWVYIGYGPDISGRIVGYDEMEWLLAALPTLSAWKRRTVAVFSVPLCWLLAVVLNVVAHLPGTEVGRWFLSRMRFFALIATVLFIGFIVSTAWLALQPLTKEFGRLISSPPKEDSVGIDRFMKNVGAVNGKAVTALLMLGMGAIFLPGVFRADTTAYFSPFAVIWAWCTYHAWSGAMGASDEVDWD